MIDLGWMLASAGAGRFLAAQGAEVIKVEHKSRWDGLRWGDGMYPEGGRAAREHAREPLDVPNWTSPNRSGCFMEVNAGKRAISLNLKHERGLDLLKRLISNAHVISEGFSPGTMERLGLGYEELRALNPKIIYVQQSGFGHTGPYSNLRSYGPTAQAFSGISEMSGLPEPFPPAGIGYSYLDWFGAYNMALAITAALYRQRRTGKGCWIDASQVETGIYLTGSAVLDFTVNGRPWARYGNRSPHKLAAPNGIYRTAGNDRWIAISCFTQDEWKALVGVLGTPAWAADQRFSHLEDRVRHQAALDALVESATEQLDGYDLMYALQRCGVAAGVCQTAEDRCDRDPQLAHLQWMVDLPQSEIGTWPVRDVPTSFSETQAFIGGALGRSGPSYGEDNSYVYGDVLGLADSEIEALTESGAI